MSWHRYRWIRKDGINVFPASHLLQLVIGDGVNGAPETVFARPLDVVGVAFVLGSHVEVGVDVEHAGFEGPRRGRSFHGSDGVKAFDDKAVGVGGEVTGGPGDGLRYRDG